MVAFAFSKNKKRRGKKEKSKKVKLNGEKTRVKWMIDRTGVCKRENEIEGERDTAFIALNVVRL